MDLKLLQKQDWMALSRASEEKIDLNDPANIEDPETTFRLVDSGVVKHDGKIADEGKEIVKKLLAKVEKMKTGIPLEKRKQGGIFGINPMECFTMDTEPWLLGKVQNKDCTTNGVMFFFGKLPANAQVDTQKGDGRQFSKMLTTALEIKVEEFEPFMFQFIEVGFLHVVWLRSKKDKKKQIAIQAHYYDYLIDRFPKSKIFANKVPDPIQFRVVNQGVKQDVIAIVAPVGFVKPPTNPQKANGKKKM